MHDWIENRDYYFDEAGMLVMTAAFLQKRGYCCGNGCRHCVYDYAAVPEPKKSMLHMQRAAEQKKEVQTKNDELYNPSIR